MEKKQSAGRTLMWSVIMASPGPLVLGLGLFFGRSSTQIADFIRRTSEFLAIVMSFLIFRITSRHSFDDECKRARLEHISSMFVGVMMCIAGGLMVGITLASDNSDKGNVIPSVVIAILSVSANSVFLGRYIRLNTLHPNRIFVVNSRLYASKCLIDSCVIIALLTVAIWPDTRFSHAVDFGGSFVVALYMLWSGIRVIRETHASGSF